MYRRVTAAVMPLVFCLAYLVVARVAEAARPGPLTCHKVECPMPGPCQVRESDKCLHGGGPPRCPGIVDAPDGTSCSDASICTTADVCTDGACGGTPVQCASATDTCEPPSVRRAIKPGRPG